MNTDAFTLSSGFTEEQHEEAHAYYKRVIDKVAHLIYSCRSEIKGYIEAEKISLKHTSNKYGTIETATIEFFLNEDLNRHINELKVSIEQDLTQMLNLIEQESIVASFSDETKALLELATLLNYKHTNPITIDPNGLFTVLIYSNNKSEPSYASGYVAKKVLETAINTHLSATPSSSISSLVKYIQKQKDC